MLEDPSLDGFAQLEQGIGATAALVSGRAEAAGVDVEGCADPMADRDMGVAVDDAVGLRKNLDQAIFKVMAVANSVNQADLETCQLYFPTGRQRLTAEMIAHVAVNRINLFAGKDAQNREVGEITGVLTDFMIEPFSPHETEFYAALKSQSEGDVIYFSPVLPSPPLAPLAPLPIITLCHESAPNAAAGRK